jgi:adenylate cyclase
VPAIVEHGGEVLKYMGDGLLAIFPIGAERDFSTICAAALEAGRAARGQIAALCASDGDGSGLRFGLALHVGDVLFGNIGSGNRLDFTCIGPAVNLAARLEKLAGRLGRTILASEDFVDHCGGDGLQPIGRFAVAGFAAEQMVFGLADEGKEAP